MSAGALDELELDDELEPGDELDEEEFEDGPGAGELELVDPEFADEHAARPNAAETAITVTSVRFMLPP